MFAYTGPTGAGYPAYVNFSRISPSGDVKVTVRGAADTTGQHLMPGPHAECVVPAAEWPSVAPINEAMIKYMVNRFLGWRLPDSFNPDGGITFDPVGNKGSQYEYRHQPVGTNLLSYTEAEAMVRYMLEGIPEA